MKRGNCLIAVWWWVRSGEGDLVIRRSHKAKRGIHFAWAPNGVCDGTWLKHRQPKYRYFDWKAMFHWFFTYQDYYETVAQCEARIEREKNG